MTSESLVNKIFEYLFQFLKMLYQDFPQILIRIFQNYGINEE